MHTIYYMEDDGDISASVTEYLSRRGFLVRCFSTAAGMRQALLKFRPDLLILDWNMPDGAGDELCGWARERWPGLPIILLTVRDSTQEVVAGFRNGADDYVTKPFEIREVLARIEVQLRRRGTAEAAGNTLSHREMTLDKETFKVFVRGRELPRFTRQEFAILELLLSHPGRVYSKEEIFEYAWEEPYMGETKTLDVHISNIRRKIKKETQEEYIETIWGIGYRMPR